MRLSEYSGAIAGGVMEALMIQRIILNSTEKFSTEKFQRTDSDHH